VCQAKKYNSSGDLDLARQLLHPPPLPPLGGGGEGVNVIFAYLSITYLAISYLLFSRPGSTIKQKTPHMAGFTI